MRIDYAVTFEFATRSPTTHRGTVAASTAATCVARAIRSAQKALKPVGWTSMNCVVLGRLPELDRLDRPRKRGRYGLPDDVHPVDAAILGGDPSL